MVSPGRALPPLSSAVVSTGTTLPPPPQPLPGPLLPPPSSSAAVSPGTPPRLHPPPRSLPGQPRAHTHTHSPPVAVVSSRHPPPPPRAPRCAPGPGAAATRSLTGGGANRRRARPSAGRDRPAPPPGQSGAGRWPRPPSSSPPLPSLPPPPGSSRPPLSRSGLSRAQAGMPRLGAGRWRRAEAKQRRLRVTPGWVTSLEAARPQPRVVCQSTPTHQSIPTCRDRAVLTPERVLAGGQARAATLRHTPPHPPESCNTPPGPHAVGGIATHRCRTGAISAIGAHSHRGTRSPPARGGGREGQGLKFLTSFSLGTGAESKAPCRDRIRPQNSSVATGLEAKSHPAPAPLLRERHHPHPWSRHPSAGQCPALPPWDAGWGTTTRLQGWHRVGSPGHGRCLGWKRGLATEVSGQRPEPQAAARLISRQRVPGGVPAPVLRAGVEEDPRCGQGVPCLQTPRG